LFQSPKITFYTTRIAHNARDDLYREIVTLYYAGFS